MAPQEGPLDLKLPTLRLSLRLTQPLLAPSLLSIMQLLQGTASLTSCLNAVVCMGCAAQLCAMHRSVRAAVSCPIWTLIQDGSTQKCTMYIMYITHIRSDERKTQKLDCAQVYSSHCATQPQLQRWWSQPCV